MAAFFNLRIYFFCYLDTILRFCLPSAVYKINYTQFDSYYKLSKVAARVKEIDSREWKYILKEQAQESERIQAIRDIGVAYGKGQPKSVTYNLSGLY